MFTDGRGGVQWSSDGELRGVDEQFFDDKKKEHGNFVTTGCRKGTVPAALLRDGPAAAQHASATNETVAGGVYYWTTEPTQGIYRYDMSTPNMAPSAFFPAGTEPTTLAASTINVPAGTVTLSTPTAVKLFWALPLAVAD